MSDATLFGRAVIDRLTALEVSLFGSVANYSDITSFERAVLARIGALEVQKFGSVTVEPDITSFTRAVLDRLTALEGGTGGPFLGALTLSSSSLIVGTAASGTIVGATVGSVVAATGLPAGLTINGAARTWAWDGTGTANTGTLTLTETLAGYGNSPHANVIGYTIVGALTAPGFQVWNGSADVTSATLIADPPTFDFTIPDSSVGEADVVEQQVDSVNTFNSADLLTEERVLLWDGTNFEFALTDLTFTPQNFTTQTGLNPAKHWYVRRRFRRDYGDTSIYSAWTTVDFTLAATGITLAWSPTDHSTWSNGVTVSTVNAANDSASAVDNGANQVIRSVSGLSSGKVYVRFIVAATVGNALKLGYATSSYGTAGVISSVGDTLANFSQTMWILGKTLNQGIDGSTSGTPLAVVLPSDPVAGDAVDMAFDFTAGKVWFGLNENYATHGDPVAGTGGTALTLTAPLKAFAGMFAVTQGDVNRARIDTKASAASHAPTGYTAAGT